MGQGGKEGRGLVKRVSVIGVLLGAMLIPTASAGPPQVEVGPSLETVLTVSPRDLPARQPVPIMVRIRSKLGAGVPDAVGIRSLAMKLDRHISLEVGQVPLCKEYRRAGTIEKALRLCRGSVFGQGRVAMVDESGTIRKGRLTLLKVAGGSRSASLVGAATGAAEPVIAGTVTIRNLPGAMSELRFRAADADDRQSAGAIKSLELAFGRPSVEATCPRRGYLRATVEGYSLSDGSSLPADYNLVTFCNRRDER